MALVTKYSSANKMSFILSGMGMELGGVKTNGKKAFEIQQGQKKEVTDAEKMNRITEVAYPFVELELLKNKDLTISGIETINDSDAYGIKVGKTTYLYDAKSGLKVAESKDVEQGGQTATQTMYFNDYKEVKGIKFPYNIVMNVGMELEFITQEVKINEGVTDADFE